VKAFLWVIGSILALDVLLVAVFAVSAAVVRRRVPHPAAEHVPWWSVEGRHRPTRALSAVPALSDDDEHAPIPIRRDRVRLVSEPAPPAERARRRPGGHRVAGIAVVAAAIFAGTAVANPQVRHFVATAIGTVSGGLTSVTTDSSEQEAATGTADGSAAEATAPQASSVDDPSTAAHPGNTATPGPAVDPRPTGVPHQGVFPPAAPGTFMAVAAGSGQIDLSWADVPGATSYRVERSPDGSAGWETASTVGQGATSVTDGGLSAGTTYFYRVIAIGSDLESAPSDTVSATTAVDVPSSPTGVTATADGQDRIDLTWNDVGGETGYVIERSTDSGATWVTIATTGQDVTATSDTGLASGTTYWYRVVASNGAGDSPASEVVSAMTDQSAGSGNTGAGTDPGSTQGSTG
jgi:hypothetical protein